MDIGPNFSSNAQRILCGFIICLIFCTAYIELRHVSKIFPDPERMYMNTIFTACISYGTICFFMAIFSDPGRPPKNNPQKPGTPQNNPLYCVKCNNYKPLRAHHCRHCNKCTLRFDHHCPWIMNCVGLNNIKTFYLLVFFLAIAGWYGVLTSIYFYFFDSTPSLADHPFKKFPMYIFLFMYVFVATMMSVTLLAILFSHTNQICKNHTTLELLAGTEFNCFLSTYPDKDKLYGNRNEYDLGNFANFTSIFGENPAYWCLPISTYKEKMKALPEMSAEEASAYGKKQKRINVDDYIQRGLVKYDVNKLQYNDILLMNNITDVPTQEIAKDDSLKSSNKKEEESVKIDITDDAKHN